MTSQRMKSIFISAGIVLGLILVTPLAAEQKDAAGEPVVTQSISINDAVNIALKNNPSIASRKALVAAAAARVGMVKAMTRLQVSATTSANAGNMPMVFPGPDSVQPQNFSITSDKSRLDQNVMAMYPLYTGGRIKGHINSAQAIKEASAYDVTTSELDVAVAVKIIYHQVLLAQLFIDAYQSRVNESQERVRIAEESYNVGRIAKYDLLRNKTELADSQQQLNNAQRDLEMALIDLKNMMGISQTSQLTLSQNLTFLPSAPTLDELQAKAINQNPELAAAQARIRSTQANVGVAKSAYKPQVYATAMGELSISENSQMSSGTDKGYLVVVTFAIPLFDGGLRRSSVNETQAMLQQMQADEREAILNISKNVATAYVQFNAATKNVGLSQIAITQAEEDYRVIRMRYEAGKATNVEVLDALASLTKAHTMYAEALYGQNIAWEAITRAIGNK